MGWEPAEAIPGGFKWDHGGKKPTLAPRYRRRSALFARSGGCRFLAPIRTGQDIASCSADQLCITNDKVLSGIYTKAFTNATYIVKDGAPTGRALFPGHDEARRMTTIVRPGTTIRLRMVSSSPTIRCKSRCVGNCSRPIVSIYTPETGQRILRDAAG
jgi:formate dehydrogenase major subunit